MNDCPHCKADGTRYVHVVIAMLRNGRQWVRLGCDCCGTDWWTILAAPQKDQRVH